LVGLKISDWTVANERAAAGAGVAAARKRDWEGELACGRGHWNCYASGIVHCRRRKAGSDYVVIVVVVVVVVIVQNISMVQAVNV
jgi:hypothetical protein